MKISRMFWSSSMKLMTSSRTRKYMHLKSPKTLGHHPFPWQDGDDEGTQAMMGWWDDGGIGGFSQHMTFCWPFWNLEGSHHFGLHAEESHVQSSNTASTEGHGAPGVCLQPRLAFFSSTWPRRTDEMARRRKKMRSIWSCERSPIPNFHPNFRCFFCLGGEKTPRNAIHGVPRHLRNDSVMVYGTLECVSNAKSCWTQWWHGETVKLPVSKNTPGSSNIAGWKMDPEWVDVFPI